MGDKFSHLGFLFDRLRYGIQRISQQKMRVPELFPYEGKGMYKLGNTFRREKVSVRRYDSLPGQLVGQWMRFLPVSQPDPVRKYHDVVNDTDMLEIIQVVYGMDRDSCRTTQYVTNFPKGSTNPSG